MSKVEVFENSVLAARKAFLEAVAAYEAGRDALRDAELDVLLAKREGEGVEVAEARMNDQQKAVFGRDGSYERRKNAAVILCQAVGVNAADLKAALS